ncbi:hypothetical protein HK096_004633 [Nowakowskiella sp. JEL0078]|nr:hypothetical protein HK096_004633 [Nowakowskiella sp. JEL0078]
MQKDTKFKKWLRDILSKIYEYLQTNIDHFDLKILREECVFYNYNKFFRASSLYFGIPNNEANENQDSISDFGSTVPVEGYLAHFNKLIIQLGGHDMDVGLKINVEHQNLVLGKMKFWKAFENPEYPLDVCFEFALTEEEVVKPVKVMANKFFLMCVSEYFEGMFNQSSPWKESEEPISKILYNREGNNEFHFGSFAFKLYIFFLYHGFIPIIAPLPKFFAEDCEKSGIILDEYQYTERIQNIKSLIAKLSDDERIEISLQLIAISNMYSEAELKQAIEYFLARYIRVSNVEDFIIHCEKFRAEQLLSRCKQFKEKEE